MGRSWDILGSDAAGAVNVDIPVLLHSIVNQFSSSFPRHEPISSLLHFHVVDLATSRSTATRTFQPSNRLATLFDVSTEQVTRLALTLTYRHRTANGIVIPEDTASTDA